MSHVIGKDAKLYYNSGSYAVPVWEEITNVRDATVSVEAAEADISTRGGNGWRETVPTLQDLSIEFGMVWDTSDADFTAIRTAFWNRADIEILALDGSDDAAGNEGIRATMKVFTFTRNEAIEDALSVDVTLKHTRADNAPEWYTSTT